MNKQKIVRSQNILETLYKQTNLSHEVERRQKNISSSRRSDLEILKSPYLFESQNQYISLNVEDPRSQYSQKTKQAAKLQQFTLKLQSISVMDEEIQHLSKLKNESSAKIKNMSPTNLTYTHSLHSQNRKKCNILSKSFDSRSSVQASLQASLMDLVDETNAIDEDDDFFE